MLRIAKVTLPLLLLLLVSLLRCSENLVAPGGGSVRLAPAAGEVVQSSQKFGLKLFREVVAQQQDTNVLISPLSVLMALGMTLNGARGETQQAMHSTLELAGLTEQEINQSYWTLMRMLAQLDPEVVMEIANSIWYGEDFEVRSDFIEVSQAYFDAVVRALDFNRPDAADIINAWIREKTQGTISELVESPISSLAMMLLIDAVYFKGTWTYEFDPEETESGTFRLPDGTRVPCSLMTQTNEFSHLRNDLFEAVDLPYGSEQFSMTVLLPARSVGVDSLVRQLTPENWQRWLGSFVVDSGILWLPKLKLDYGIKLKNVLGVLGMEIAFGGGADFSGISYYGGLFIEDVVHKTYIEVNEAGTEASAVTEVMISIGMEDQDVFFMRVDRPFVFVIREHQTGSILFIGRIVDPTSG